MKIFKKILCIVIPVIIIGLSVFGVIAAGVFNKFTFTVDTTKASNKLHNVVNNINIWSIEGNPFVNATASEENNIFEFVDYVQFMQCSGGTETRDLFKDPLDRTVLDDYDFTLLIENCRGVLNLGGKPMLKLGSVPLKYSEKAATDAGFGMNRYPPDDYDVYYDYIKAIAKALVKEFGKKEVLSWRFGVMTEYENADWFIGSDSEDEETLARESAEAYCKLYDYTAQALVDVLGEDVFVGAHSMSVTEGIWDEAIFIEHCAKGTNYKTGKTGSPLKYLSASFYDSTPGDYTEGYTLPETIDYIRNVAESNGLTDLIYGIDEGRILCGVNSGTNTDELLTRTCGYTYQAAYDARLIAQMFNNDIAYFSAWSYLSNGFLQGNPTVSYHVAKNAAKMAGAKLTETTSKGGLILGGDIDAVSAFNEESETLHIMAYNFKNDLDYKTSAELNFEINAPQFDGKKVKITTYTIDDDCNYFDEWVEDRKAYNIGDDCFNWSPDDPEIDNPITLENQEARNIYFNELYGKYTECSKLVPTEETVEVENGKISLSTTLDPHAVVFYEITEE